MGLYGVLVVTQPLSWAGVAYPAVGTALAVTTL